VAIMAGISQHFFSNKPTNRSKDEEPDFFELEKTSPLPTLTEAKLHLEAKKLRRMHEQLHGGDTVAVGTGPILNDMPTTDSLVAHHHFPQGHVQRRTREGGAKNGEVNEKKASYSGAGGAVIEDENLSAFRGDMSEHHFSSNSPMSSLMQQERFRQMREDQFFYQHQMNMMQANHPLGMPYGTMGSMGHSGFNPYHGMPPPS
jgi:hypothetical protein